MKVRNQTTKTFLTGAFLLILQSIAWSAPEYMVTNVFTSGEGYHTYRIPAMVRANDGTLLAFCEGRASHSDLGDIDIVLKRSTDNGETWGPLIVAQAEGTWSIGNPAPVVDRTTGDIHMLFCRENETVFHTVSTDNGLTWSTRTEITSSVKLPGWGWYATGPCHGVQLTRGDQAGRLVIPANHAIGTGASDTAEKGAQILYSDDHGVTWNMTAIFERQDSDLGVAPNETTLVELNTPGDAGTGSHIYINSRDYGSDPGNRSEAWSGDGGGSYSVMYDGNSHFVTPVCQGSLIRFRATDEGDAMNRILFSSPNASSRVNGSIWTTTNEATSWSAPKTLFAGEYAYSDMAVTASGDLGVLAECNENGSAYDYIKFIRVNEEWLDVPPPPPPPVLPVVVDVDFSHLSTASTVSNGVRIQDNSGSTHHGFWGDSGESHNVVSTYNSGFGIDTTTSTAGDFVYLRGALAVDESWFSGTTPIPYFTMLAASNYTFEAVVNFNGRNWDGAGTDGLMGQTGGNEFWMRAENGFLKYAAKGNGLSADLFSNTIDIKSAYDGQFHNITVVFDRTAGEIRSYLDGSCIHTNSDPDIPALGDMLSGYSDFRLGAYNTTSSSAFKGIQDRYRISSFARDPSEFIEAGPALPDTEPPLPNPASFVLLPASAGADSITMTATTGIDPSGPVEYLFIETSGNPGGSSSGWVTDSVYIDTGLTAGLTYTYTVTLRDALGNTGTPSAPESAVPAPPPPGNVIDMDFEYLSVGNTISDGVRLQDVSGNGYHGFWGHTLGDTSIIATPNGTGIDNTTGSNPGYIYLRDGLTGIPEEWDGPTTTVSPYFSLNGGGSFTLEAVVKWDTDTVTTRNGIMGQTGGDQIWVREDGGNLHYAIGASDAVNRFDGSIDISAEKADGEFHSITLVYDGPAGEVRTYVDGVLKDINDDVDIGTLGTLLNGTGDFRLGDYNGSSNFDGTLDHFRISSHVLLPDEFLKADGSTPPDPAVLTISIDAGDVILGTTNLSARGGVTNTLQFKEDLADVIWSNVSTVVGVTETNWVFPASLPQGFYRIESTY